MSFLIKNENPLEGKKKVLWWSNFSRATSLRLPAYIALSCCCSQMSSSSSRPVCPPRKPKTSNAVRHLCICNHCYFKLGGSVAAIYSWNIPIRAGFSQHHSDLHSYEFMSQSKVSRMASNEEEDIVEKALTGGVFLCHSLDKVSAISLVVNTLIFSHLSLVIYYLPLPLSPFHCLLCVCASCSESVVRLAYVQSSLLSFSLHYSLKMGCHHHWRLCISISPSLPLSLWQDNQCSTAGGWWCHVACACFCVSYLEDRTILVLLWDPQSCYQ